MLKHLQNREDFGDKSIAEKGFTLIELLVVIIILGILAAVAIFAIGGINDRAKQNACKTEVGTVETAVAAYAAQHDGTYPTNVSDMIGSDGNLKKTPKYVNPTIGTGGAVSTLSTAPSGC